MLGKSRNTRHKDVSLFGRNTSLPGSTYLEVTDAVLIIRQIWYEQMDKLAAVSEKQRLSRWCHIIHLVKGRLPSGVNSSKVSRQKY